MKPLDEIAHGLSGEQIYFALFETAPDAVLVVDSSGRIVAANPQAERMFGYPVKELQGELIEKLVPERFRAEHPRYRDGYIADPAPRPMGSGLDLWGRHKSGEEFPVEISLSPLRRQERTLISAAVRDITDRKRAQDELRKARDELEDRVRERTAELAVQIVEGERASEQMRRHAEMLDLASEPIFAWDMEQGIVFWNKAAIETYGYAREETMGRVSHELLATVASSRHRAHPRNLESGRPLVGRTLAHHPGWPSHRRGKPHGTTRLRQTATGSCSNPAGTSRHVERRRKRCARRRRWKPSDSSPVGSRTTSTISSR